MDRGYLVVIPAHNEVRTLGAVVGQTLALGFDCLVVDDASDDGTARVARAAGAMVLRHPVRLGAWLAIQTGMFFALKRGYPGLVSLDADGQHLPAHIPDLLAPLEAGEAEVVIGACPRRLSRGRRLASLFFRKLAGLEVSDFTSGFRAYGPEALRFLCAGGHGLLEYQDLGVLLSLRRAGFRILEVPVEMEPRSLGRSRVFASWLDVLRYLCHTGLLGLAKRVR